jgi:hypothetical protein
VFIAAKIDPELAVAWATLLLAVFTATLAWYTSRLARSATAAQRAEWRPVLIPASEAVDESVLGELGIEVRNVGRGPALGVNGQLRIAGPSGAVIPGQPSTCLPGETLQLRFGVTGDHRGGLVRRFEVTYYDIGERWHTTDLAASIREQDGPLAIRKTFVTEMSRQLSAIHGSRQAVARQNRPWRRAWRWAGKKIHRN